MTLTPEQVRALKDRLQKGDVQAVADATGLSYHYVSRSLNGREASVNPRVVRAALDLIQAREQQEAEMAELIGQLR